MLLKPQNISPIPHHWVLVLHHSRTRTPEPEVVGWVSVSSTRRCLVALSPQKTALQAGPTRIGSLVEMTESEDPKVGIEMVVFNPFLAAQSAKVCPKKKSKSVQVCSPSRSNHRLTLDSHVFSQKNLKIFIFSLKRLFRLEIVDVKEINIQR